MLRIVLLTMVCAALAGCQHKPSSNLNPRVTADLNYVETSLGFRNSGILTSGKIYLWDLHTNRLTDLRTPLDLKINKTSPATNLFASQVEGIQVSATGKLNDVVAGEIAANIGSKIIFEVKNAEKVDHYNIYDALTDTYTSLGESGPTIWHIEDLKRDKARYRYVITLDPVFATEESILLSNDGDFSGGLTAINFELGNISVEFPNSTNASCSGARAACFVNLAVLEFFIKEDGNLDYKTISDYEVAALSSALRSL